MGRSGISRWGDGFAAAFREELDFRIEAGNLESVRSSSASGCKMRVPHVYEELSTDRALVMDWLDAVSVRDGAQVLDRLGVDRREFARQLLRC
ncbi:MAG: AarF/UbiB family protein [Candidatus Dormibacteraeota bacterium]|nr:AarF/UbiB family protein [Candidatus Dormibacteraeota bacterium]